MNTLVDFIIRLSKIELHIILLTLRIIVGLAVSTFGFFVLRREYRTPESSADFDRLIKKYLPGAAFILMGMIIIVGKIPFP